MGPARDLQAKSAPTTAPPEAVPPRAPRWPVLNRLRPWRGFVAAGVVVVLIVAVTIWRISSGGPEPITRAEMARAVQQGIEKAQQDQRRAPPDAVVAYRAILPSLVTITTQDGALGAGVIVNNDGTVLTALHVVEDGSAIVVTWVDGTRSTAKIAKSIAGSDIAMLAVDALPTVVVPAVLGGGAQVGASVFSAGNPLGLEDSLTAGVVSGLDRATVVPGGKTLHGLIQFDAAVNPGNSGGPLLNRDGQVLGIVTGLANPSKQPYFIGIGFAVPIETAGGGAGGPQK